MIAFLYQALNSLRGIVLRTSDGDFARQKLYQARTAAADADLDALAICISPTDPNEVWVVKKGAK